VERFLEKFEPATDLPPGEFVVADTTRPPDAVVEQILRQVRPRGRSGSGSKS
jgi:hypothetical protein